MSKVLLDTDILSEFLKGRDRNVARRAAEYARQHRIYTFTSITVFEIVFGLEVKNATVQLEKAMAWLNQNEQIAPAAEDYREAAILKAVARKQGSIVELTDCLIASVAIRLEIPLATGNTSDFEVIQKTGARLTLENWREA